MPVVAVTRLHLGSLWPFPRFLVDALRSSTQARRTPGFITGWLAIGSDRAFWTSTVWDSVESMRAFRNGGVHLRAMPKLLHWCDEASYVHWEQADAIAPTVDVAVERLTREGKLSKVNAPSALQRDGKTVGRAVPRIAQQLRPVN